MWLRRRVFAPALLALACASVLSIGVDDRRVSRGPLPSRLTDQQFWRLSVELSEPNGFFRSENLVSNEHTYQYVIPSLERSVRPSGVYLGVAPDQNFTYIIATRPKIAFIVDVRRGNLLQHLMYKALFELSADRVDFVSKLVSRPRPAGLAANATVDAIFTALAEIRLDREPAVELYRHNLQTIKDQLLKKRGLPLSPADLQQLESIYYAFFYEGPAIRYSTSTYGTSRNNSSFPTYEEMLRQTDWDGQARSYLANEERFAYIKQLQARNLIVPVVGNFAGPKALRAVGQYIREHGETVSVFYVSNVEQYLFQDGIWPEFARNVATLPLDESSVFIRSVSSRFGYSGPYQWEDGRASALDPIKGLLRDFEAGRIQSYYHVNVRSR
jgi:hypothetical protein